MMNVFTSKFTAAKSTARSSVLNEPVPNKGSQERILKKRGYTLGRLLGEGSYAKVSFLIKYHYVLLQKLNSWMKNPV